MQWIGLTGGIGSGKSTVAKLLQTFGEVVIDADELAKQVLKVGEPGYQKVIQKFGSSILGTGQEIDRTKLALRVFSSPADLLDLEQIIHPEVQNKVLSEKENFMKLGYKRCFYDVPLLFEKKLEGQFDAIVLVYSSLLNRKQRIQKRNNWSSQEIEQRINAQIPLEEKIALSDFVIHNDKDLTSLEDEVKRLFYFLDKLSIPN